MKTVFVIGAGASMEFGLPNGQQLKDLIAELLDIQFPDRYRQEGGDGVIWDAIENQMISQNAQQWVRSCQDTCWRIRDGIPLASSIDNYIDSQKSKDVEFIGKLAITRAILEAESNSALISDHQEDRLNFEAIKDCWLNKFFQLVTEGCSIDDLPARLSGIAIINFNYDRCIEHFLYHSIKSYYNIGELQAAKIVGKIYIYHPYGNIGCLPWMKGGGASIQFGGKVDGNRLLGIANGIRTFAEGTDPASSEITEVRTIMGTSKRVVFLGFAFHRLNMKMLIPEPREITEDKARRIFATAYGISGNDSLKIRSELGRLVPWDLGAVIVNAHAKCDGIFHEYSRSLSLVDA